MHKRVESGSAGHLQGKDHLDEGLRCRGPTSGTLIPLRAVCRGSGAIARHPLPSQDKAPHPTPFCSVAADGPGNTCLSGTLREARASHHPLGCCATKPGVLALAGCRPGPCRSGGHTWFSSHQGGPSPAEGMGTREGARREGRRDVLGKGQEVSPKTAGAETGPERRRPREEGAARQWTGAAQPGHEQRGPLRHGSPETHGPQSMGA